MESFGELPGLQGLATRVTCSDWEEVSVGDIYIRADGAEWRVLSFGPWCPKGNAQLLELHGESQLCEGDVLERQ